MARLVVVGSLNLDLTTYVERFPIVGETLRGSRYETGVGGKGCNQAAMAARMAATPGAVVMVGCVGQDVFADKVLAGAADAGVDTALVRRVEGVATGNATITVDASGDNTIVLFPGANDALAPDDVGGARAAMESAAVVVCQNEVPPVVTSQALAQAKELGKLTVFNPAPAPAVASAELASQLAHADILVPNETEAAALLGLQGQLTSKEMIENAAKALLDAHPVRVVVITAGPFGALLLARAGAPEWISPPPLEAAVVDTSGAGDAFVGAFAWTLASQSTVPNLDSTAAMPLLRQAATVGCAAASLSVTQHGCQQSYPARAAVEALAPSPGSSS